MGERSLTRNLSPVNSTVSYTSGINGQLLNADFQDNDNDLQVIRLITRLLFVWFLKEKVLEGRPCHQTLFEKDHTEEHHT